MSSDDQATLTDIVYYLETRFGFENPFIKTRSLINDLPNKDIWEYIYKEFTKSHVALSVVQFERDLIEHKCPETEFGTATDFLYDSFLLMSQYFHRDPPLFNSLLNLAVELTHYKKASKYRRLVTPRNLILALSLACTSTTDLTLSATFFSLALQILTSYHPTEYSVKMVYQAFLPSDFGGYNTVTRMQLEGGYKTTIKRYPSSHIYTPNYLNVFDMSVKGGEELCGIDIFSLTRKDSKYQRPRNLDAEIKRSNTDASFFAHLRRALWLMGILSHYQEFRDTDEAKDMWDLVAEEISTMMKKKNFRFKALYEYIPR